MSTEQKKVVAVSYTIEDIFKIPIGLDLENKNQVKDWGVKWNRLYIELTNGKELVIEAEGWIHHFDYKRPTDDQVICDAEDFNCEDDEDWEYFDCQTGEQQ